MGVWNDPVSTLNHTIGFKKFGDYQLESTPDDVDSLKVGLSTDLLHLFLRALGGICKELYGFHKEAVRICFTW